MTPTAPTPDQRRAVVLHVGMGKTGTTSLQARMHRNRDRLEELGVLYPATPGRRRHLRLGLAMQDQDQGPGTTLDWRRQDHATPAELRPVFEEAFHGELAASSASHVLFSDEALFGSTDTGLRNLADFLTGIATSVRVVVYLRRQDDHVTSRYQQAVKRGGEVRRLTERLDHVDLRRYDYHERLLGWQRLVAPDETVVRLFERDRFVGGSLDEDFLDATGLGIDVDALRPAPTRNESLDAESVEFLRQLNLFRADHPDEVASWGRPNDLVTRAERASDGPTLTLPDDVLDRFVAPWQDSNRAVARDFVPDAPDSLFTVPRKTGGTTTEQHLDPARVDHFVDVLRLPDGARRPLREIAEREA